MGRERSWLEMGVWLRVLGRVKSNDQLPGRFEANAHDLAAAVAGLGRSGRLAGLLRYLLALDLRRRAPRWALGNGESGSRAGDRHFRRQGDARTENRAGLC